jgi:hypothetical protein
MNAHLFDHPNALHPVPAEILQDIELYELNQLMMKLYQSNVPEPVCGRLAKILQPMADIGYISLDNPRPLSLGEPITASRMCPPGVLLHFFWGVWLPVYCKQLSRFPRGSQSFESGSLCTVVLQLPEKKAFLADVLLDLSLRLEGPGIAEIVHMETGDTAQHREFLEAETRP